MRGLKGSYSLAGLIAIFLCGFLTLELGAAMEAAAVEVKIVSPSSGKRGAWHSTDFALDEIQHCVGKGLRGRCLSGFDPRHDFVVDKRCL